MPKLSYLIIAATLLGLTACTPENKDTPKPPETKAMPQTAAESNSAPSVPVEAKPAEMQPAKIPVAGILAAHAASGPLTQEQALALAKANGCLVCHKIDAKLVGPSWKEVGAKYKGDANAARTVAANIKKGGSFGWKFGVMPPRGGSKISDADIDSLAGFIVSLK